MGFFDNILSKLGLGDAQAAATATDTPTPTAAVAAAAEPTPVAPAAPAAEASAAPAVASITMVDVQAQMEKLAAANPQKLNWRTSIVDLLKLLDMDSSLAARKALATELYCPDELMADSAQMNMWLHKTVLAKLAANGGNVPKELLD